MALFTPKSTSKLRSALHLRYSIVIPRFIPHANYIRLNPNNHYNYDFHDTFHYNHFINNLIVTIITVHSDC